MKQQKISSLRIMCDHKDSYAVSANDFVELLQRHLEEIKCDTLKSRHDRNVLFVLIENVEGFIRDFQAAYPQRDLPEAQVPLEFRTLLDYITQLMEHEKKDGHDTDLLMSYKAALVRMHNNIKNQVRNEKL